MKAAGQEVERKWQQLGGLQAAVVDTVIRQRREKRTEPEAPKREVNSVNKKHSILKESAEQKNKRHDLLLGKLTVQKVAILKNPTENTANQYAGIEH